MCGVIHVSSNFYHHQIRTLLANSSKTRITAVQVLWNLEGQHSLGNGDLLCRTLVSCDRLVNLQFNFLEVSLDSLKLLNLRSQFPNLQYMDLVLSTNRRTAEALGLSLSSIQFPTLQCIKLSIPYETFIPPTGEHQPVSGYYTSEAMIRSVLEGLSENPLPCLHTLAIINNGASKARFATFSATTPDTPAWHAEVAQHGREFASSLCAILHSASNLKLLHIESRDLTPHAVQHIGQCMKHLACLTRLCLSWAEIGPQGAAALREHANGHSALLALHLNGCVIEDDAAYALHAWIQSLPELHSASFLSSDLGPMGVQIMEGLKKARSLRIGCNISLLNCIENPDLKSTSANSAREAMQADARCTLAPSPVRPRPRGITSLEPAKNQKHSEFRPQFPPASKKVDTQRVSPAPASAPVAAPGHIFNHAWYTLKTYSFTRYVESFKFVWCSGSPLMFGGLVLMIAGLSMMVAGGLVFMVDALLQYASQ